jgi:hypothetical protein
VEWITIDVPPEPAHPAPRMVYRTRPQIGYATDGRMFYLKGPAPEIVVAEVLGYTLATQVGLPVPGAALCRLRGEQAIYFASEAVGYHSALDRLVRSEDVYNPNFLGDCIAFDVWTANDDRNIGNIVGRSVPGTEPGTVELLAIDFEQAHILHGDDFLAIGAMPPRGWWPKDVLGSKCRGLSQPDDMCMRIGVVTRDRLDGIMHSVMMAMDFQPVPWAERAAFQLANRASKISTLVREAWHD